MSSVGNSPNTLFTGQLPSLEAHLPVRIRELQGEDPFAEVWVIIPNQLTRLHLRRRVAESLGVVANLRFITVHELARTLAEPITMRDGWRTLGEAAVDPLLTQIVSRLKPSLGYVADISTTPGFRRALLRTRQELILHEVSPHRLLSVTREEHDQDRKLRDLAELLIAIDTELDRLRWHDSPGLLRLAAEATRDGKLKLPPIIFYALYDLPPLARRVLARSFIATHVTGYLTFDKESAEYEFTRGLYEWFLAHEFSHLTLPSVDLQQQHYFISAPDNTRAASEVVRSVLMPAEDCDGEIGIVLQQRSGAFTGALRSRCREAGLAPFIYEAQTLGDTAAGRGLRAFSRLLGTEFAIEDVTEYLLTAPFQSGYAGVAGEWVRLAQEAMIVDGAEEWQARLTRLRDQLGYRVERLAQIEDENEETLAVLQQAISNVDQLKAFLQELFTVAQNVVNAASWQEAINSLWSYYSQVTVVNDEFSDIVLQLSQASLLDTAGIPISATGLREFMEITLSTPGSRTGRFLQNRPVIATREQCYGVTFASLHLPGCNEGTLPRIDSQDPLLLDSDRMTLNKSLNCALPLRRDWQARERFWFSVLRESAQQIYYYTSRADDEGRPQLVSPYLSELMEQQCRGDNDTRTLDEIFKDHPLCRYAAAHPLAGPPEQAISAMEYHRRSLSRAIEQHSTHALDQLWSISDFSRAFDAEYKRFSASEFSQFEGRFTDSEVLRNIAEKYDASRPVSVTALEDYWKCPFRFAVTRELEAYAPEACDLLQPVSGRERGSLLHRILQKYHAARTGKPYIEEHFKWADLQQLAEQTLADFKQKYPVGPAHIYQRMREDLLETLEKYHDYLISAGFAWQAEHVEVSFGQGEEPYPDPLQLVSETGEHAQFRGRIDRWDVDSSKSQCMLTDYKSGRIQKNSRGTSRRIQLGIYRELIAQKHPDSTVETQYLHINSSEVVSAYEALDVDAKETALSLLHDIRRGVFVPDPDANDGAVCRHCNVKLACGAMRHSSKPLTGKSVPGMRAIRDEEAREEDDDE